MTLIRRTNKVFVSFLFFATSNKDEVTRAYTIGREGQCISLSFSLAPSGNHLAPSTRGVHESIDDVCSLSAICGHSFQSSSFSFFVFLSFLILSIYVSVFGWVNCIVSWLVWMSDVITTWQGRNRCDWSISFRKKPLYLIPRKNNSNRWAALCAAIFVPATTKKTHRSLLSSVCSPTKGKEEVESYKTPFSQTRSAIKASFPTSSFFLPFPLTGSEWSAVDQINTSCDGHGWLSIDLAADCLPTDSHTSFGSLHQLDVSEFF